MALLFILHAVDDHGAPYDESDFEPVYFAATEHGGDAAAEAAAVAEFEWCVALGGGGGWQLVRAGFSDGPVGREVSPVVG
ncbi:hypothetical protein [Streptomyces scabiei]|uniref:hypothetical protein n=1 Tax=Streptomyces scabiei TaxID=1930 RepID=UPI0029B154F0|nr:hypothetical protein [Streptomyces scabiei]MDX3126572.1 hypothetical protein [Streptomyces scabiei]MDX3203017.1 hypothetical protein [Streptomyces scabiei]MDX3223140.1 hypothetical protein [Streptomyces scabiei]